VCCVLCAVCCVLCAVCCVLCAVCCVLCAVCCMLCVCCVCAVCVLCVCCVCAVCVLCVLCVCVCGALPCSGFLSFTAVQTILPYPCVALACPRAQDSGSAGADAAAAGDAGPTPPNSLLPIGLSAASGFAACAILVGAVALVRARRATPRSGTPPTWPSVPAARSGSSAGTRTPRAVYADGAVLVDPAALFRPLALLSAGRPVVAMAPPAGRAGAVSVVVDSPGGVASPVELAPGGHVTVAGVQRVRAVQPKRAVRHGTATPPGPVAATVTGHAGTTAPFPALPRGLYV
jgi:hypothetical protein